VNEVQKTPDVAAKPGEWSDWISDSEGIAEILQRVMFMTATCAATVARRYLSSSDQIFVASGLLP